LLNDEKFKYLERNLLTFDIFKHTLETIDESKLDEIFYITKGIVTDYKNAITLLAKISKLLDVQHIFCEKVLMTEIFERICDIVCQTLECDRCTLYLVDNVRKELWSRVAKDSKSIIKLPFGKGLAGFVAENKTNLVLDDAYFDPRFNKEYDVKTGYRTKSVLCVPIYNNRSNSKEVIGVIQALNKKVKPFIFDTNDEITSELLAKMIGTQLKQSMEYSDYTRHEHKLKNLINHSHDLFNAKTADELVENCREIIKALFSTENVNIFVRENFQTPNHKVNMKFLKYNEITNSFTPVNNIKLGLLGEALSSKNMNYVQSTYHCEFYNPTVDIETTLPICSLPVFHPNNDCDIISLIQFEYNLSKLGVYDVRSSSVDSLDLDLMESLKKIFSKSLLKFNI
jgi:transcriptional regulator with GAF, ATPase, and Fis domain